ncbi:glycosyltransferase family 4 protein [Halosimplex rubrum]|uniref:Glycosyltransferase family 4 protein n=1 Tax=Halosimplex rubrum TaxID=869889 RepID=A0A7D5SWR5_9EURY|nr:glycosyltransferase family 4 protein [Halosimplex rubrum]QLH76771.1 glycosyltransferase family 4 protein [Halosimplex rubrum]
MRVGFVHPTYPQGEGTGATHSASRIVFELADRGHDVTVYCWADPPADATFERDISVRSLDADGSPYHSALQLDAALRERVPEFDAFDVVHSYVLNSLPALGEVAAETSAATVLTLNAYGAVCPKNDLRYMDREPCTSNGLAKCAACSVATSGGHDEDGPLYRSASRLGYLKLVREGERVADRIDAYHALSPHIRETYAEFGFPRDRLTVIPNILDERFDRAHGSDFEEPYELLYVGSLDEHKGVDRLVPVLDRLNGSGERYRLTVVGDGGLRTDLEAAADERGLGESVTFTGWLDNDDLPALYAAHDCFLYPGRWDEPFGRVFLEALAAGTPVVASDVGSVAAIVGDGGVTTDGSVEGFVDAVRTLFDGDAAATSAAANRTVERYRADAVVPQFEALYERAVERSDAVER